MKHRWNVVYTAELVLIYHPESRVRKAMNYLIHEHRINIFDDNYFVKCEKSMVNLYQQKGTKESFIGGIKK